MSTAYNLNSQEAQRASALLDAYHFIMFVSDSPDVSGPGLDLAARIQKRICDEYNAILLKGWVPARGEQ